jgi:hypothetical protein
MPACIHSCSCFDHEVLKWLDVFVHLDMRLLNWCFAIVSCAENLSCVYSYSILKCKLYAS